MLEYLLPVYFVMWFAGVGMHFEFKRRIRIADPQLAERLYQGLLRKSIASDRSATRFLMRGEFRTLQDPRVVRFGEIYRAWVLVWGVVFMMTMIAFIVAG